MLGVILDQGKSAQGFIVGSPTSESCDPWRTYTKYSIRYGLYKRRVPPGSHSGRQVSASRREFYPAVSATLPASLRPRRANTSRNNEIRYPSTAATARYAPIIHTASSRPAASDLPPQPRNHSESRQPPSRRTAPREPSYKSKDRSPS